MTMTDFVIVVMKLADEDGGGYLGYVPDLPGCMSDGATRAEAVANTEAAMEEWIDTRLAAGLAVPSAGDAVQRAEERDRKLVEALQAYIEYGHSADKKIRELERKLTELLAVLKEDAARPKSELRRADLAVPVGRVPH
jgi:antitoxin HicB